MSYPRPNPVHRDFDRQVKRAGVAFGSWFIFCALLGVGILGVAIWAVIRLVLHFT